MHHKRFQQSPEHFFVLIMIESLVKRDMQAMLSLKELSLQKKRALKRRAHLKYVNRGREAVSKTGIS